MRSHKAFLLPSFWALLCTSPFLATAQDDADDDVDYNDVWKYAPDFSNDEFPPFPSLKDDSGNNITVENLRGTHLFGYKGCENEERNKIDQAFKDMHTITSKDGVYKNIDWAHSAAVDFFGPSAGQYKIPDDTREEIQQIYAAANEVWSYWWSWQPPWLSYRQLWIEVRCSDSKEGKDSSDPEDTCGDAKPDRTTCPNNEPLRPGKPTLQAFSDPAGMYSRITFCNDFFNLDTFQESMDKQRSSSAKKRLDLWDNQARCFLHELTHLDYFVNAGPGDENKSPYVSDLEIKYTAGGRRSEWFEAYGPYAARVLTNYRDPDPAMSGYYTQRNADNYAWFALAKYVEGKIGEYPSEPAVGRKKPTAEPQDSQTHGPPQKRGLAAKIKSIMMRRQEEDEETEGDDEGIDPPDDMPEYPGCADRPEPGPGAAAEEASISASHEATPAPTGIPDDDDDDDEEEDEDLPEVKCANSDGVRFHKSIADAVMKTHCGNKDNWNKTITPPISLGNGTANNGKETTWKVTDSTSVPDGTDLVWLGMLFAQDSCMGHSDFVVGRNDDERLSDCADPYLRILDECSDGEGWTTGGSIKDVCIVYDIRGSGEGEKPYDGWYEGQGDMKCDETDTSAIGGEESNLFGTCTCWYEGYEGLTEVFDMPDSADCADVDEEDIR